MDLDRLNATYVRRIEEMHIRMECMAVTSLLCNLQQFRKRLLPRDSRILKNNLLLVCFRS